MGTAIPTRVVGSISPNMVGTTVPTNLVGTIIPHTVPTAFVGTVKVVMKKNKQTDGSVNDYKLFMKNIFTEYKHASTCVLT